MTDTERLGYIKTKVKVLVALADDVGTGEANLLTVANDMNWLVEKAEQVQGLERNIKLLEGQKGIKTALNNDAIKIIEEKERENKRLREALEFYADSKNYQVNVVDQWGPEIKVMMDGGAKAAKLLEELK